MHEEDILGQSSLFCTTHSYDVTFGVNSSYMIP